AVSPTWQRRAGIRHSRDIGIAEQRKDRMIKRRGADFDLAALRGLAINGKNQIQQLHLLRLQGALVVLSEFLPFASKPADYIVFLQPLLVHPGKLRKYLKIAPVTRR